MTQRSIWILGSLSTAAVLADGCYAKPDVEGTDTMEATSTGDGSSSASNTMTAADSDPSGASMGTTTSPVGGSSGSSGGPIATSTTTEGDTGPGSTGGESTGGLPACADGPVSALLPGAAMTQCGGSWSIDVVTFQIQNSLHPTCGGGQCSAGSDPEGIWVYPAQLYADLTAIGCEASVVEVRLTDYTAANAWVTLFDDTGAIVASDYSNLNGFEETVSVAVPLGTQLAAVGVHGCETLVHEITVL
jgi:hypothetical protein